MLNTKEKLAQYYDTHLARIHHSTGKSFGTVIIICMHRFVRNQTLVVNFMIPVVKNRVYNAMIGKTGITLQLK